MALALAAFTALAGYVFGIAKDRSNKKMEAITKLHDRVIEIDKNTLFAGDSRTLIVSVVPARKYRSSQLSKEEFDDCVNKLQQWRDDLFEEERRARLWLSKETVDLVGN